jgi:hypothetical protein
MEDLPFQLAWNLAELASQIRDGGLPVDRDGSGQLSGQTLEWLADQVILEGLGTPAAYELIAPPRFRLLPEILPTFEQMLVELGCPSVEGLAEWWPEEQFMARYPQPSARIGRAEAMWLAVCRVSPAFRSRYERLETGFYTAGELGRTLADLFQAGGHEDEIRAVFTTLDETLTTDDSYLIELVSSSIDWLQDKVTEDTTFRWAEIVVLLPPRFRGWFGKSHT